jgi:hypothetical protein
MFLRQLGAFHIKLAQLCQQLRARTQPDRAAQVVLVRTRRRPITWNSFTLAPVRPAIQAA